MKNILTLYLAFSTLGIGQTILKTSQFPVKLGYTVELPPDYDSTRSYPLIVGLHGLGDRMASYVGFSQELYPEGAIGLYPETPYPFFMSAETMGWTWCLWGDTTDPVTIQHVPTLDQSIRWIAATIEEVKRDYPVDPEKVFLFGFSQGGFLTFNVGMRYPELFRGLMPGGGWLEFDTLNPPVLDSALLEVPVQAFNGYYDDVVDHTWGEKAVSYLKSRGVPAEILLYPAKHVLTKEIFEDAGDFIWRELNRQDSRPLVELLNPAEPMESSDRVALLKFVLCAQEPVADIETGLLSLYEEDTSLLIKKEVIYLLGSRRCLGAEDILIQILNNKTQPAELRQASYSALIKLASQSAWETVGSTEKQVVITRVVPGSQAEGLGLLVGDVILTYNRKPITNDSSISEAKKSVKPKQHKVEMTVLRAGERMKFKLHPGSIGIYTEERIK